MSQPSRASEQRDSTRRAAIGGAPRLKLDVDLTGLPAGYEARWIRESTLGERDRSNVQDAMMNGYKPATVEMLPNANPPLLPGDADESHGLIRRFGQILMLRPKTDGDAEREYQRQEGESQKNAAKRLSEAKTEAGDPQFDGVNFRELDENKVSERVQSGRAARPKGDRFTDA